MVEREIGRWRLSGAAADRVVLPGEPAPLITISGELGSGDRELAKTLGARLRWPVYDRELVEEMVRESHTNRQQVLDIDEGVASRAVLWLGALVTQEMFDYEDYRSILLHIMDALSEKGSAIILGRGANFAPKHHPRLDVRIIAPLGARVERLVWRDGMTRMQAMAAIRRSDHQQRDFTQHVYQGRWDDAGNYDLVISTGFLTVLEAAELVEDALRDLRHLHIPRDT
jgi:cytidylate kinase